jgi:NTP pyrophosphatase (non-canonical NTP hydrolase)
MTPKQYVQDAAKTDHRDYAPVVERISNEEFAKLTHYTLGLGTEVGEVLDILKKRLAYGKPIDIVNLKEELGDLLWYVARLCGEFDFTFEELMDTNIAKLKARYGEKFTENAALNRDLANERKTLETQEAKNVR